MANTQQTIFEKTHFKSFEKSWHSVLKFVPDIIKMMKSPDNEGIEKDQDFINAVKRQRKSWNRLLIGYRFPQVTTDLCSEGVMSQIQSGKKPTKDHVFGTTYTGYYHRTIILDKKMNRNEYWNWLTKNNRYVLFGLSVDITSTENMNLRKHIKKMWSESDNVYEKIKYIENLEHYKACKIKLTKIDYLKTNRRYTGYGDYFKHVMG